MPQPQNAPAPAPAPHPQRPPRQPRRCQPRPETAVQPGQSPQGEPSGPLAALRAVPRLTGVRPLLARNRVEWFIQQQGREQARARGHRALIQHLVARLPVPGEARQLPLTDQLAHGLEACDPMKHCDVQLRHEEGHIQFHFDWAADGLYDLHPLQEATRRLDPEWLPGLVAALEGWTALAAPVIGPRYLSHVAEYWWNLDQLSEGYLSEELEHWDLNASERFTLAYARRKGLPHPYLIQDATPWRYYRPAYTPEQVVTRTRELQVALTGKLAPLRGLSDQLAELSRLSALLPTLTNEECQQVGNMAALPYVISVEGGRHNHTYELANEYMQAVWTGGDNDPHCVLHVRADEESPERLRRYLTTAPRVVEVTEQVLGLLSLN